MEKVQLILTGRVTRDNDGSGKDATIIFLWPDGEEVIDNLLNRHGRPYDLYKSQLVPQLLKKLKDSKLPMYKELYKRLAMDTWKWNQKAGCGCGCSPGLVGSKVGNYLRVHVHYKIVEPKKNLTHV